LKIRPIHLFPKSEKFERVKPTLDTMMSTVRRDVLSVLLFAALPACGGGAAVPDNAVAVVGDRVISVAAYERALEEDRRAARLGRRPVQRPQAIVAVLVDRAVLEESADDLGVVVPEAAVEKQLAASRARAGGERAFRDWLARMGRTPRQFREDTALGLLRAEIARKVAGDATIGEAELRAYYRNNISLYRVAPTRQIRHILVPTRAEAAGLRRRIVAGASFASLARQHSRDASARETGGRLLLQQGLSTSAFQRVTFSLSAGAISQPVRSEFGFHLIQPLGRATPERWRSFDEVREPIRRQLVGEKRSAAFDAWREKAEQDLRPRYREPFGPAS
jgi:parvulin-like peptidyl-prolyl isomerase